MFGLCRVSTQKKLKFSNSELASLAEYSQFSYDEVKRLYAAFREAAGKKKAGGLDLQEFLSLFGLEACQSWLFARKFAYIFWEDRDKRRASKKRLSAAQQAKRLHSSSAETDHSAKQQQEDQEWENVDIGFQEFIRQYGTWCRGPPQDRLFLLWRLFACDEHTGRVTATDIERLLKSMFDAFLLKPWEVLDATSAEFQIHGELVQLFLQDEALLAAAKNDYFHRIAKNAIRNFHHEDSHVDDDFLWRREFDRWVVTMPGICEQLCVADPEKPRGVPSWGRSHHETGLSPSPPPPLGRAPVICSNAQYVTAMTMMPSSGNPTNQGVSPGDWRY